MRRRCVGLLIFWVLLMAGPVWAEEPVADNPAEAAADKLALLRQRVRHVFIIFQENRSFDHLFGSFPGARGLYSQPPAETPGYEQTLTDPKGREVTVRPFRIGPEQYAWDTDDVDHAFQVYAQKLNIVGGRARMNRYAAAEQAANAKLGPLQSYQQGILTMAHVDCDTVPISWRYADRFTLFDHYFTRHIGPSAPSAISINSAQIGETQWVRWPGQAFTPASDGVGVPILNDNDPAWGPWYQGGDTPKQINLKFATWPLLLTGNRVEELVTRNTDGIRADIAYIQRVSRRAIPWGWYQNGYNDDPHDPNRNRDLASYIPHHNGPQFFGYVANNPALRRRLHGLRDLFPRLAAGGLPKEGGVFMVRGGYTNLTGLVPVNPSAAARAKFAGDDSHAGYSDLQISDALVARTVNAIARSRYWASSVILITYDEGGGWYDSVPPPIRTTGPTGVPMTVGPRIPMIVISPFANTHTVSHEEANHASVSKFIEDLFDLPRLADLPSERAALSRGRRELGQCCLGPWDKGVPGAGNLLSAFSYARLAGSKPMLKASYAEIPDKVVNELPHYGGRGCKAIGVTPLRPRGGGNPIPPFFNPLPETNPTK
ncbi:MAG: alkaline phosphatase family protein [Geminicoccaceae bacterium]